MAAFSDALITSIETHEWIHKLNDFGKPLSKQHLVQDPYMGAYVDHIIYHAGTVTKRHTHSCAHGIYVLSGTLLANGKEYPPGTMIWFPQGAVMEHGATEKEDVEVLFFYTGTSVNRPFDISYCPEEGE